MKRVVLVVMCLFNLGFAAIAQLVSGDEQSREWTRNDAPNGMTITNRDKYVDYKRNGKVVLRKIKRVTQVGTLSGDFKPKDSPVEQLSIEFVADDKVIATVFVKQAEAPGLQLSSGEGVYFATGYGAVVGKDPEKRYFYLSIPKLDYFEYVETNGVDVSIPDPGKDYELRKRAFFKGMPPGSLYPLGKEPNLQREK